MPRKKHIIEKKVFKMAAGACRICGEDNYALLDVHRIKEGAKGGRYTRENSVTLCCSCHRRVHAGTIKIDRYYLCTDGSMKLLVTIDGKEEFL
jgi:5-methylcytosine-specific restriction endonuclease McrA